MEKCDYCGQNVDECEAHHFEDCCECEFCINTDNAKILNGKQFCSAECQFHFISENNIFIESE